MQRLHVLRFFLPILLFISLTLPVSGQSGDSNQGPYYLSLKRDLLYGGLGAGSMAFGSVLRSRTPDITLADLRLRNIPSFDRVATRLSSEKARAASDSGLYASAALPSLLLLGNESRRDFGKVSVLFAETMAFTSGMTYIIKSTALRPRPYVFDENLDPATVINSRDRAAFLSGHTSVSAAGGFFFARVFSDYYPDSKLKPYAWALGAGLPALTGYLRIRGGQHYPSDVVAGYALGATIGYLIPTLHKKPLAKGRLSLSPTGNGVYASFRLQ